MPKQTRCNTYHKKSDQCWWYFDYWTKHYNIYKFTSHFKYLICLLLVSPKFLNAIINARFNYIQKVTIWEQNLPQIQMFNRIDDLNYWLFFGFVLQISLHRTSSTMVKSTRLFILATMITTAVVHFILLQEVYPLFHICPSWLAFSMSCSGLKLV